MPAATATATGSRPPAAPAEPCDVLRLDVPMGGEHGVAPYRAAVWPDGSHCTMDDLRAPCGDCGGTTFEVLWRRVAMPGEAKGGEPNWMESYAALCPRCMPLGRDGRNLFGRMERRTILGWFDKAAGAFIPVGDEGAGRREGGLR